MRYRISMTGMADRNGSPNFSSQLLSRLILRFLNIRMTEDEAYVDVTRMADTVVVASAAADVDREAVEAAAALFLSRMLLRSSGCGRNHRSPVAAAASERAVDGQ